MPTPGPGERGQTIPVVAVMMLHSNGKVLMLRRPAHKHHGNMWEFPGGKVEAGESPETALIREIREELGVVLEGTGLRAIANSGDPDAAGVVIDLYRSTAWSGTPRSLEGGLAQWFEPCECGDLDLAPLDRVLLARIDAAAFVHPGATK